MVEAASAFLMSSLAQPMIAPNSSVTAPTSTTPSCAPGARSKMALDRAMRYTPAVTMVAAWMSAETGVGPSMASPSQDCSGTCADLPQAASNSSRPMAVSVASLAPGAAANTVSKPTEPKVANMAIIASANPMSPTLLTTNAFFAAVAAEGLWYQKPISR
ncbi:Uncharacterised protein [Mycobacteroides abscessus subsp. abscessus]|nr:Uncharacterised protein [Mycobacteroides abscessus subsp. abscessus]